MPPSPNPSDLPPVEFEFDLGIDGATGAAPVKPRDIEATSDGGAIIRRKAKRSKPKPAAEATRQPAQEPAAPLPTQKPAAANPVPKQNPPAAANAALTNESETIARPGGSMPSQRAAVSEQAPVAPRRPAPVAEQTEAARAKSQPGSGVAQPGALPEPASRNERRPTNQEHRPPANEGTVANPFNRNVPAPALELDLDDELEIELEIELGRELDMGAMELDGELDLDLEGEQNLLAGGLPAPHNARLAESGRGSAAIPERPRQIDPSLSEHRDVERRSYGRQRGGGDIRNKMIIAAALATAAAGIAVVVFNRGDKDNPIDEGGGDRTAVAGSVAPSGRTGVIVPPRPGESDAEISTRIADSLAKFFSASSPADLLGVVRSPQRVKPLIEDYYSRVEFELPTFVQIVNSEEIMVRLHPLWQVTVELQGGGKRVVAVEDSAEGFRVDWENYVHYNPIPWETFATERPSEAMAFRVYAKLDHRPGYAFPEVDKWFCVQLTAHGSGKEIFGYVERISTLGQRIHEMLVNEYDRDCILGLQFPEDGKGNEQQVYIRELVSEGWILVD